MRDEMTGLEFMQRVSRGDIEGAPFARLVGMKMTEVVEGLFIDEERRRPGGWPGGVPPPKERP